MSRLVNSRYNFHVPVSTGAILFNASSGAAIFMNGADAASLSEILAGQKQTFEPENFNDQMLFRFKRGGFLVPPDTDELKIIRERYWNARADTPIVLTITTTQDCNLGCYYCYESRTKHRLSYDDISVIAEKTKNKLRNNNKRKLHVDWYGGEPLLNIEFMEAASIQLQNVVDDMGVKYTASVISNGTLWPDDVIAFVKRHKIRQVQISIDGLRKNHNKRRHYRKDYVKSDKPSSFDKAVRVIDNLLKCAQVDLRFNLDAGNKNDIIPFIEFCEQKGWFEADFPLIFQPARLSSYSERSSFMRKSELSLEEFEEIRCKVRQKIPSEHQLDETSSLAVYPHPRTSVCAALATDSVVIGAEGHEYRCGLQVGEINRAVKRVMPDGSETVGVDNKWWDEFDPTVQPKCAQCSFLPVCWGGCPKKHLESDTQALDEQSFYWRKTLPQKIAYHFGIDIPEDFAFDFKDQFKDF